MKRQILITIVSSLLILTGCDRISGGGEGATEERKKEAIYKWAWQDVNEALHHRESDIPREQVMRLFGLNTDAVPQESRELARFYAQRRGQRFLVSERYFHKEDDRNFFRNKNSIISFRNFKDFTETPIDKRTFATCELSAFEHGRAVYKDCITISDTIDAGEQNLRSFVDEVKAGKPGYGELQRMYWNQFFTQDHLARNAQCYENIKSWECQQELNKIYSSSDRARDIHGKVNKQLSSLRR